jgi:hypothetical protein
MTGRTACKYVALAAAAAALAIIPACANALPPAVRAGADIGTAQSGANSIVDTLTFGDAASEQAHGLSATLSQTITGALGQPARVLLPKPTPDWQGGSLAFTMRVDPVKINYFTIRLSGDDVTSDRLILLCNGEQIGYRHLGDVDLLDDGTAGPALPGRFYYRTCPLPLTLTQGKTSIRRRRRMFRAQRRRTRRCAQLPGLKY